MAPSDNDVIEVRHGSDADLQQHRKRTDRLLKPRPPIVGGKAEALIDKLLPSPLSPTQEPKPEPEDYNVHVLLNLQQAEPGIANANLQALPYTHLYGDRTQHVNRTLQWKRHQPLVVDEAARAILSQHPSNA